VLDAFVNEVTTVGIEAVAFGDGRDYVDVGGVKTWYAEQGSGDPLLLLHGAFTDASEFGATTPALSERFHDRLVLISGNFRHDGLAAELDLGELAANDYLAAAYGQVSPGGRGHFPVIADKIFRMATTEPTLTESDLAKVAARPSSWRATTT
jgi:hypothetical protein